VEKATEQASKKTVLVVDDEEDLREILSLELSDAGYNVLCAVNGTEAFNLVKSQAIDLVLSDVRMPNGDGIELLKNVKKYNSQRPAILLMSGFSDVTPEEACNFGAEALFNKPINFHRLLRKIAEYLQPQGAASPNGE
jgi:CheY-like chemotaxis protein